MSISTPRIVFARADAADWPAVRAIRTAVFVEEQACPEDEEFDGLDESCEQILGTLDGEPVACARWRAVEKAGVVWAKLERFAILAEHRGGGNGRRLVGHVVDLALRAGHRRFLVHAQAHLQRFYESFGFVVEGEAFDEAGIPHVRMTRVDEPA